MICGIHLPGTLPCRHCERAARATAEALAHVVPSLGRVDPQRKKRTPRAVEERAVALYAETKCFAAVARACGVSETTASAIVRRARRDITAAPNDMARPRLGSARRARVALPLPRSA